MNAITGAFTAKLRPLQAECWQAWSLGERDSLPIALDAPDGLDEAVMQAVAHCQPGGTLAVQYAHAGRRSHALWLFAVKRSSKVGMWRESTNGGRKVFVGRLEPKLICQSALAAPFAPVEAFDAFRDDPVGRDLTLVEARKRREGQDG